MFGVPAMLLEVPRNESLDRNSVVAVEVTAGNEMIGHRPGLVAGPGLKGGDELALIDQAVLQCKQAEEKVTRGMDGQRHDGRLPSEPSQPARCFQTKKKG